MSFDRTSLTLKNMYYLVDHRYAGSSRIQRFGKRCHLATQTLMGWRSWLGQHIDRSSMYLGWWWPCNRSQSIVSCTVGERPGSWQSSLDAGCWVRRNRHRLWSCLMIACSEQRTWPCWCWWWNHHRSGSQWRVSMKPKHGQNGQLWSKSCQKWSIIVKRGIKMVIRGSKMVNKGQKSKVWSNLVENYFVKSTLSKCLFTWWGNWPSTAFLPPMMAGAGAARVVATRPAKTFIFYL